MTDFSLIRSCSRLDFRAPMSNERADRLVNAMATREPSTVLDVGCGWGELLLRALSALPQAHGLGFEISPDDVERARANATARELHDRVEFRLQSGAQHTQPADLVLCVGASQVFGDVPYALSRLRSLVAPGGRLLFADGFWQRHPSSADLERLWPNAIASDHTDLSGLVGQSQDAGFTPLWIETANRDEWEYFESGFIADETEWLLDHPDVEAAALRQKVAQFRTRALTGTRDLLGFAFLTLGVPR